MHHDTAPELSFAPRFRPFYPGDVQGYSTALDSLVYPGELSARDTNPRMSLKACRLVGGGLAISFASTPLAVRHGPTASRRIDRRTWRPADGSVRWPARRAQG